MNAVDTGRSFHKAELSFTCLLNPAANSTSRYKHVVHYKCVSSRCPQDLGHSFSWNSLCIYGFDRVTVKALKGSHVIRQLSACRHWLLTMVAVTEKREKIIRREQLKCPSECPKKRPNLNDYFCFLPSLFSHGFFFLIPYSEIWSIKSIFFLLLTKSSRSLHANSTKWMGW